MKPAVVALGVGAVGFIAAALYFAYRKQQVAIPTGVNVPARRYAAPVNPNYRSIPPVTLIQPNPMAAVIEQPTGTTTTWDSGGGMSPAPAVSTVVTEQPSGTTTFFG